MIEVVDKCDIDDREKYWIDYYRKNGECYCIQDGGQPNNLVVYVSSESRKRTGELNRQRMLGSKLTEETKAKMSKTQRLTR